MLAEYRDRRKVPLCGSAQRLKNCVRGSISDTRWHICGRSCQRIERDLTTRGEIGLADAEVTTVLLLERLVARQHRDARSGCRLAKP